MELTNELIEELFKNDIFKEKLNEYVVENINVQQNYDAYTCKYDQIEISFAGKPIEIKCKTYGY